VARIAKMMSSKAEKQSHRAAKTTLVINKLIFVFLTVGVAILSSFQNVAGTFWTNQLLWLMLQLILHFFLLRPQRFLLFFLVTILRSILGYRSPTLTMSSEIGVFAFIAFIVIKVVKCKFL